jgi:hypothetical protein
MRLASKMVFVALQIFHSFAGPLLDSVEKLRSKGWPFSGSFARELEQG